MFASFLMFVKGLLICPIPSPPTFAEEKAFLDYEDEFGYVTHTPSPAERYQMDVEWRDSMIELSLWTLLRWRLAVAWMPFCGGRERRLIGERLSRKLFPDLYGQRRKKAAARKKVSA